MSEPEIASELLRYTVDDPGQALGYHAGRRYLRELRGTQNIREFHDAVLASGPSRCGSSESPWPLLGRRAAWKYPEGIQVIAEYWPLSSAVQVVSILAAESIEKIMEVVFEWNDIFDIDVYPAVSAEEGLRIGPEVFARLPRMQQQA